MDILIEFLVGLFVELPMESEHVKTRTKTILFLIVCGILDAFTGFLFYQMCFVQQDLTGSVICGAVLLFLLALTIFGSISGHKRNWK